jgi:hypothetical protein
VQEPYDSAAEDGREAPCIDPYVMQLYALRRWVDDCLTAYYAGVAQPPPPALIAPPQQYAGLRLVSDRRLEDRRRST